MFLTQQQQQQQKTYLKLYVLSILDAESILLKSNILESFSMLFFNLQ